MTRRAIPTSLLLAVFCFCFSLTTWADPGANSSSTAILVRADASCDPAKLVSKYGLTLLSSAPGLGGDPTTLYLFQTPGGKSLPGLLNPLSHEQGVLNVESNAGFQLPSPVPLDPDVNGAVLNQSTVSVLNQSTVSVLNALLDNSPLDYFGATVSNGYVQQPAMQVVNLSGAQQLTTGAGITIALIDGAIDDQHAALQSSLLPGFNFLNGTSDVSAWSDLDQSTVSVLNQSTVSVLNSLPAYFGHATEHAGVLHLVAPQARLLPVRAFQMDGTGQLYDVIRAIYYAVDQGANVISMSFSCDCQSQELAAAVHYAMLHGVLLVGSVGNDGSSVRLFPAAYGQVIGVSATNLDDTPAAFSNYGSSVWVAAPGAGVITTFPGGNYAAVWGTSFSSPQVAAEAALLLSYGRPQVNLKQYIAGSSTGCDDDTPRDTYLGFGRIDLLRSLLYQPDGDDDAAAARLKAKQ